MRCKVIASRTRMFGCHFSMCLSWIFDSRARFHKIVWMFAVFRVDSVIGVAYGIESIEWMNAWMNVKFKTKRKRNNLEKEIESKYQRTERANTVQWVNGAQERDDRNIKVVIEMIAYCFRQRLLVWYGNDMELLSVLWMFAVCSQNISTLAVAVPEHFFFADAIEKKYCNFSCLVWLLKTASRKTMDFRMHDIFASSLW